MKLGFATAAVIGVDAGTSFSGCVSFVVMYPEILFIHSWTRWIVLVAFVAWVVRCFAGWFLRWEWSLVDRRFSLAVVQAYSFQVLFGVTLWLALSPVTHAYFRSADVRSDAVARFWTVRHPAEMLVAFILYVALFGFASSRARPFRAHALLGLVVFALICAAVPWPFAHVARPWFRFLN